MLVTVRDGRVLGDVSGAGAGAALRCYWGCCAGVLLGLLFSGVGDGWQGVVAALTVARNGSWLVYHHDVVNHVMMLLQSLRRRVMVRGCGGGHSAVNIRLMLNFITLSQDDSWLWYDQDAAFAITMML